MRTLVDRRRFNLLLGAGVAASALAARMPRARAAGKITVLNWQGYGTDEAWALKLFSEQTGIEVVHDYFNSEQEMFTKLRTNPGAYDVALINSAWTSRIAEEGLLEPIDFTTVPNSVDLDPTLKDSQNFVFDGKPYGVAWVWGMNGLGVRKDKAAGAHSLEVLWSPEAAGRVALYDDAITEVGIAALLFGESINDPKDMKAVVEKLKAMKPNVKLIWSSEDQWNKAFSAGEFDYSIYWSGAAGRSQKTFKLPVEFIVPKEGAIGWLDGLSVPASAPNKAEAVSFINWMIDPKFYVQWATEVGAPASANAKAMEELPADDPQKLIHKTEYLKQLQFMSPMPDERRQAFVDAWEEVKAFYAS